MKHYVLIASLIIFLACGGGKEAVVEETEPFSAYPSKPAPAQTQPRMVSPDSLALMFAQSQQPQTEPQPVVTAQDSVSTESVETTAEPAPVSAPDTVVAELSTELVETEPEIESEEIPRRKIQIVEEESKPDVIYMQQIHRPDSSVPVRVTKPEIATETTTMTKAVRGMENLDFRDLLILDPIFFDANQTGTPSLTFNSNYIITLSKIVEALKRDLELNVRLFGYTDRDGDPQRNLQISEKRCVTIGKMICDMFDNAERDVISSRIELIPIGEADPLVEGNSPIRRVLNRRVAMVLTEEPIMGTTLLDYMRQGSQLKRPVARPAIQITKDVSASGIERNYQSGMESYRNQQYDQKIQGSSCSK